MLLAGCASRSPAPAYVPLSDAAKVCAPSPLGKRPLYLRGAFNNWNADERFRFAYRCDAFELVARIDGEHAFKLGDEQWSPDADFGAADHRTGRLRYLRAGGANLIHRFNGDQRIRFTPGTLTMSIDACPAPPLGDAVLYLRGTMNNWAAIDDYAFQWSCDAYYLNVRLSAGQQFKVATADWKDTTSFGVADGRDEALDRTGLTLRAAPAANIDFMFNAAQTLRLAWRDGKPHLTIAATPFDDAQTTEVTDPVARSASFDSRSGESLQPFGAVTAGTVKRFSFRAAPGVSDVRLVIERRQLDGNQESLEYTPLVTLPMTPRGDLWQAAYRFDGIGVYGYFFEFTANGKRYVYGNNRDSIYWTRERGSNGVGEVIERPDTARSIRRFRQTIYAADFTVPAWAPDVVYYYIFPDRFRNGDRSNDPTPGRDRYQNATVEFHANWNDKPYKPKSGDGSDEVYNNDFFGGDLAGITEKLDYIRDLGANTLYLTPIFKAPSNHKYDTADYEQIDPAFGSTADFERLTAEAARRGMRVILDASLNHVGSDSRYFNRFGNHPSGGAFDNGRINAASPYASWFRFDATQQTPDRQYKGWVGISDLPELDKTSPAWRAYAYGNPDSVMKRWLDRGAAGWRMDVAPWVPDDFWREWRTAIRAHRQDALTVSEAWFDSSKYLLGDMFDSTMNYVFRNTVQDYALGGDARALYRNLELLREAYPPQAHAALMNLLSSHDQPRMLHQFGYRDADSSAADIALAKARLRLATLFQVVYPGSPTVYYGDEVGVTGGEDPYNRATYPWADQGGRPDMALHADFKRLLKLRAEHAVLRRGTLDAPLYIDANVIVLVRRLGNTVALVALNNAATERVIDVALDANDLARAWHDVLDEHAAPQVNARTLKLNVPARFGRVLLSSSR